MEAFGRKITYSLDSLKKPLLTVSIFHVRYFFLCIFVYSVMIILHIEICILLSSRPRDRTWVWRFNLWATREAPFKKQSMSIYT